MAQHQSTDVAYTPWVRQAGPQ